MQYLGSLCLFVSPSWNNWNTLLRRFNSGLLICLSQERHIASHNFCECEVYLWIQKSWVWIPPLLVTCSQILGKHPWTPLPNLQRSVLRMGWADVCRWSILILCVLGPQWMSYSLMMPYSDTATISSLWAHEANATLAIIMRVAAGTSVWYILGLINTGLTNEWMPNTYRDPKQVTPIQSGRDSSEELTPSWSLSL